jgi:hypothetical protein
MSVQLMSPEIRENVRALRKTIRIYHLRAIVFRELT